MPTVALVIIGDELLSSKFADENGPYLLRQLRALGAEVVRMSTISDSIEDIADEVRRARARADLVLTTGGVGPTHDDRTLAGVARALNLPLCTDPRLIELFARFGLPDDEGTRRMAQVPVGSELIGMDGGHFPTLVCQRVFVFPGVPRLMQRAFEAISDRFRGQPLHCARLYVNARESLIATRLGATAAAHPAVAIGSYPRLNESDAYKVIITLESRDPAALTLARTALESWLPLSRPG